MSTAVETAEPTPGAAPALRRRGGSPGDAVFRALVFTAVALVFAAAAAVLWEVTAPSHEAWLKFGPGFLTGTTWDARAEVFGALPFIYGTLVTSAIALILAFPVGLGVAIYLARDGRAWLREPLGTTVELLAAVPSVVFGIWALFILEPVMRERIEPTLAHLSFIPLFGGSPSGSGFLTAGLVLAVMILPTISAIGKDVIRAVPRDLREGSLALGATEAETVARVVLPAARAGLTGAVILALGRALGETIAVTMVIGNAPRITAHLFEPGYTMASVIANEFTEAVGHLYTSSLIAIATVLLVVSILVNALARVLLLRAPARSRR